MARAELGSKHTCLNCGVKFYDLNKFEIICPACGTEVTLTSDEPQVPLQTKQTPVVAEDIVQDDAELEQEKEPLDNNLEGGSSKMIIPLSWMMMTYSMTNLRKNL